MTFLFWTDNVDENFQVLEKKLAELPTLVLPDFNKLFTVECDANKLSQGHTVAFFSKKLNDAKYRYFTYVLELYALVQMPKKWRHYLLPKEFIVSTNNHALRFINGQEKHNPKYIKWMKQLQAYTFTIKHKKGVTNKVADVLNRRMLTMQEVSLHSMGIEPLKELYKEELDFKDAYNACLNFSICFHVDFSDYMLQEGLLFKGNLLCVPKCSTRENIIREKHNEILGGHFGLDKILEQETRYCYWSNV